MKERRNFPTINLIFLLRNGFVVVVVGEEEDDDEEEEKHIPFEKKIRLIRFFFVLFVLSKIL